MICFPLADFQDCWKPTGHHQQYINHSTRTALCWYLPTPHLHPQFASQFSSSLCYYWLIDPPELSSILLWSLHTPHFCLLVCTQRWCMKTMWILQNPLRLSILTCTVMSDLLIDRNNSNNLDDWVICQEKHQHHLFQFLKYTHTTSSYYFVYFMFLPF